MPRDGRPRRGNGDPTTDTHPTSDADPISDVNPTSDADLLSTGNGKSYSDGQLTEDGDNQLFQTLEHCQICQPGENMITVSH